MKNINFPEIIFSGKTLVGERVAKSAKRISELAGAFADETARNDMNQDQIAYEVECYFPVAEDTMGGLSFGISHVHPGMVGNEYMMTKGHFHKKEDRAEFYWGIEGEGMLILMNRMGETWAERLFPGSLHYIPGHTAHRIANTGTSVLSVGACWPSDSGHDYETIQQRGFSKRLLQIDGVPQLVASQNKLFN